MCHSGYALRSVYLQNLCDAYSGLLQQAEKPEVTISLKFHLALNFISTLNQRAAGFCFNLPGSSTK